jgi:hypothetical protein
VARVYGFGRLSGDGHPAPALLSGHNVSPALALSTPEVSQETGMKISMEILTIVEFEISADKYPAGIPDTALSLEIEQASRDPHEYVAMRNARTSVIGRLVRDNGQLVRMRGPKSYSDSQRSSPETARRAGRRPRCSSDNMFKTPHAGQSI